MPAAPSSRAPDAQVVVFGSINVDWVVAVSRIPSPGETVMADGFSVVPGGKGCNQALAARRAGARVAMAGAVGDDAFAAQAMVNLVASGVDVSRVARVGAGVLGGATGVALIQVDPQGNNTISVAGGANRHAASRTIEDAMLAPGTVVLCDLEVESPEVLGLARRARAGGATMLVNASPIEGFEPALMDCVDLFIVNEHEAAVLARLRGDRGVEALLDEGKAARPGFVVTRGAEGAGYGCDGLRGHVPAPRVEAIDTVGAGDAFAGTLAAALARGMRIDQAVGEAVRAGSQACTRAGAQWWP